VGGENTYTAITVKSLLNSWRNQNCKWNTWQTQAGKYFAGKLRNYSI